MYEYKAKITRVVDGDTLKALVDVGFNMHHNVTLRLYGIDCPETRTKDLEEKEKGFEAKNRMINILESCNYEVNIKSHGVDKYGRCLAEVVSITPHGETKNINRILLDEGLAVDYHGGKKS